MGAKKVTYNKETFLQEILLYRIKDSFEESDQPRDNLILFNDNIRSFKYWNDFFTGVPKAEILFEDINNQEIAKIRCDGYSFVRLSLQYQLKKNKKTETVTIAHDFILSNVTTVNKKADSTVYKLTCISFYNTYRDGNIIYSSKNVKSSTQIVEEMLEAGKYPYDQLPDLTQSNKMLKYIAPVNAGLGDCIDEILSYTSTVGSGLYYVIHNISKNKAQLVCVNDVYSQKRIGSTNYVMIPTKDDFADFERSLMDLDSNNYIPGEEVYNLTKPMTFNNFNYLERSWSKDKYNYNNYKDINCKLSGKGSDLYQKIYKDVPKIVTNTMKFSSNFEPLRYKELRSRMNKLTFFSDVVQFKCTGNIKREVGELIAITCSNENLGNRYGGVWFIVRIYHKFEGGSYYNEIIAVRSDELKAVEVKAGTTSPSNVATE